MIKSLEIQGFKSFERRISIPLSSGFTAVVGPNGSGKSNVIDSICFVLGMTSAKSMRAERLTHLIYNGGKSKTPAQFLEVSLVLDNTNRAFPFDTDDVIITRRLTRKGTMSYKLNGNACTRAQLVDVLSSKMFDSNGHNIVLQGDVTNFIEMDPVQRRQIIDNICGIAEYDEKKEKAVKDLAVVEERIKEVAIVMGERKKTLDTLKKEKEDAEKYSQLKEEVERLEASLAFTRLKHIEKESKKLEEQLLGEEAKEKEVSKELKEIEENIGKNEQQIKKLEKKLFKEGSNEQVFVKGEIERFNGQISINQSKIESKQAEIANIDAMVSKLQQISGEGESTLFLSLKDSGIRGIHGSVGELFHVESKYSLAVKAAMGPRLKFIVVEDENVALECIEFLKKNHLGRLTFLPLNKIKGPKTEIRVGKGIIGLAQKLVKFKPEYREIFGYVLGNTYVVTSLRETKGFIGKMRMVSLDGDLAEKSGAITGGYRKRTKAGTEIDEYIQVRDKLLGEIEALRIDISDLEKKLSEAQEKAKKLGLDMEASQKSRDALDSELSKMQSARDTLMLEKDSLQRRISDLRVEKARVDAKLTDIQINMRKFSTQEIKEGDIKNMETALNKITQDIVKLEPVNMKAIELYDAMQKEYGTFIEKFDILQQERKSVLSFIDEIEGKKKEVFYNVFNKVSEEFSKVFLRLSPNGEARLYLENTEMPLNGGMFVEAKPSGKKILSIEALSGGEKVITALSFLLALQRYKPAPFYVLDEVDAALDQNNSMRFVELLQETAKNAQLLIISHNSAVVKRADRIYGVSMTSEGTSKIVGIELKEFEEQKTREKNGT